jgi:hypothetical protein
MTFNNIYAVIHDFVVIHPLLTLGIIVALVLSSWKKTKDFTPWIIGIIAVIGLFYLFNMYQDSTYTSTREKKDYINLPKYE